MYGSAGVDGWEWDGRLGGNEKTVFRIFRFVLWSQRKAAIWAFTFLSFSYVSP